jgi:LysR family hydrogen peroxide-inducible transcriptional activator
MTTYLPTLKQLQYLVALFEHKHFGKAADACFVTQSTLSSGIKELESLLDLALVERTRRVVRFTPLGEKMVGKAHQVLCEAEELAEIAKSAGKPLSGDLRMSVIPTIAPFLLPQLLPKLRRARPELKLYLREEPSQAACNSLHQGNADCALLALPYHCGDVEVEALFTDELFLAMPADEVPVNSHRLDPQLIDPSRLLLLEDGHCLKDHALSACNRPEIRVSASIMGTSLHTLVQMVDNGLGATMLPAMAIESGILQGTNIAARPLLSDHPFREIALVWRRGSPRSDEFLMLAQFVRDHI